MNKKAKKIPDLWPDPIFTPSGLLEAFLRQWNQVMPYLIERSDDYNKDYLSDMWRQLEGLPAKMKKCEKTRK